MADEKHLARNYPRRNKASEAGCHGCHGCHCCNHWHYHWCGPVYIWPNTYPATIPHQPYPYQVTYNGGVYTQAASQQGITTYMLNG